MHSCVLLYWTVYACVFFNEKTAYEMRISDWSSDVCSSDLPVAFQHLRLAVIPFAIGHGLQRGRKIVAVDRRARIVGIGDGNRARLVEIDQALPARRDLDPHLSLLPPIGVIVPSRLTPLDRKSTRLNSSH